MGKLRLLELFSGYGTASFALKQLGIDYECVGYSDIDKYANQCFQQNHSGKELGDVKKINVNDLGDFDLLTGGFPCQAFSVAGKMLGELDARGTLFNEIIRIAEVKRPRYMMLENVRGLLSKSHTGTFDKILSELDRIGYSVQWQILNTKDYGIPQNRERVFFACFRDSEDWEKWPGFPEKEELRVFLKDILEEDVDEKYYLSEEQVKKLLYTVELNIKSNESFIAASRGRYKNNGETEQRLEPRIDGCTNTITSVQKDNYVCDFLPIVNATKKGYLEGYPNNGVNLEYPNSETRRDRIQKNVIGCLQTNDQRGVITKELRIRKLTPAECFRLQGFSDDDINLDGISNSQKYKLCGNGQSVNVVKKIFEGMLWNSLN